MKRKSIRSESRIEPKSGLEEIFRRVADHMLSDRLEGESLSDPRQRAMILVGVLAISASSALFLTVAMLLLYLGTGNSLLLWATLSAALTLLGYFGTLFYFKRSQRLLPAANLYALTTTVSTVSPCLITGGVTQSPYLSMVLVVPIFLFLMAGRRHGILWSAVTAVCVVSLLAIESLGVSFPQVVPEAYLPLFRFVTWMMTLSLLVLGLFGYDSNFESLTRRITAERGHFAYEATHDALTGLGNRKLFFERATEAIEHAEQFGHKMALIYIDLDGFKAINDASGHDVGDEVLKAVARRLKDSVRAMDTVVRLGGDEFAIALHDAESEEVARFLAEKLRRVVAQPVHVGSLVFKVTGSFGVAVAPDQGTDVDDCSAKLIWLCTRPRKSATKSGTLTPDGTGQNLLLPLPTHSNKVPARSDLWVSLWRVMPCMKN